MNQNRRIKYMGYYIRMAVVLFMLGGCSGKFNKEKVIWHGAGDGAMVSPDGRLVSYIDWHNGNLGFYEVEQDTFRKGTDKGDWSENGSWVEGSAVFSPDGDRVAFSYANVLNCDPFCYELNLTKVDDTRQEALFVHPEPSQLLMPFDWNEDRGILFLKLNRDKTWELNLIDPNTKSLDVLIKKSVSDPVPGYAKFIYGGRAAVFHSGRGLKVVDLDNKEVVDLDLPAVALLGWNPTSQSIIYSGVRDAGPGIFAAEITTDYTTGISRKIREHNGGLIPAGSYGQHLYYVQTVDGPGVYLAEIDTDRPKRDPEVKRMQAFEGKVASAPVWSNDGSKIAYCLESNGVDGSGMQIMVTQLENRDPKLITEVNFGNLTALAWSPDDRYLYFSGRGDYYMESEDSVNSSWTGRVNIQSGEKELLTPHGTTTLDINKSGELVYQKAFSPGENLTHIVLFNSGEESIEFIRETPMGTVTRSLSFSPDGETIAFVQPGNEKGTTRINLINKQGENLGILSQLQRPEVYSVNQGSLPWTPDGKYILVDKGSKEGYSGYVLVALEDGTEKPLYINPKVVRSQPDISPDGTRLVYIDGEVVDDITVLEF